MRRLSLRKYLNKARNVIFVIAKLTQRYKVLFLGGLAVVFFLIVGVVTNESYFYKSRSLPANTTLIIAKGASFRSIVDTLHQAKVIKYPLLFSANIRLRDKHRFLKAGEYAFSRGMTPNEVMQTLLEGKTVLHRITIPEGLTSTQILDILGEEDKLTGTVPIEIQEGTLLPETYYFSHGDSREDIILRMQQRMINIIDKLWQKRQDDLPISTPEEAVVLASIVEKETSYDNERGRVAAVFINRLRKNMRLQSDPTVIYAITKGREALGRRLLRKDLRFESPFNTYVSVGLPPHPIAHPGRASIEAVLNPPKTNELYFVASGDGGHNFATNLKDHNRNVRLYRKKQNR